ncbi:MAG: hypothetical protein Q4P23_16325 [Micrococcaceae bacterium]|nr:hypothetical protein [Micrococcaceae bacterium]
MTSQHNGGGLTPSRRTLVKGAAWSVPVVAVATPAFAVACSPNNTTPECNQIDIDPGTGQAHKTPGNKGCVGWPKGYWVETTFCVTLPPGITATILLTLSDATLNGVSRPEFVLNPTQLTVTGTGAQECRSLIIFLVGEPNSANSSLSFRVDYTYSYTVGETVIAGGDYFEIASGTTPPLCPAGAQPIPDAAQPDTDETLHSQTESKVAAETAPQDETTLDQSPTEQAEPPAAVEEAPVGTDAATTGDATDEDETPEP